MEKIDGNYDVLWDANNNVFALKGYNVNGYVRAFVIMCYDGIPLSYIYDVNTGRYISICKDEYGLIDDKLMEVALKRETNVIGFDVREYDSLQHISCDDIYAFFNKLQLPAADVIRNLTKFNMIERRK